ncbi:helix-turn-helix domain-containing protein [Novosphingobium naphthalenivorans]|uniref:helix-turn-helix domain-containing protein n=1 Tax=Novosphingobium naphthalenivorans TaxID=273168 RepID=UPI00082B1045|nr:AraC family transcriptional regulator [Novosphingobium naphthalenivorans]
MSLASSHRHFRGATAMTPVQYPKQIRLQAARRLLLAEGVEVAAVGYAIGYESPSQSFRNPWRSRNLP